MTAPLQAAITPIARLFAALGDVLDGERRVDVYDDTTGATAGVVLGDAARLEDLLGDAGVDVEGFADPLAALAALAQAVRPAVAQLTTVLDGGSPSPAALVDAIAEIRSAVETLAALPRRPEMPAGDELVGALVGHLVVRWLRTEHPAVSAVLAIAGIVDEEAVRGRQPGQLRLDRLAAVLGDPASAVADALGWTADDADLDRVMRAVHRLGVASGLAARLVAAPAHGFGAHEAGADEFLSVVTTLVAFEDGGLVGGLLPLAEPDGRRGVVAYVAGEVADGVERPLGEDWRLRLQGELAAGPPLGFVLSPSGAGIEVDGGAARPTGVFELQLRRVATDPISLLDTEGLTIDAAAVALGLRIDAAPALVAQLELRLDEVTIALDLAGDGFLAALLPEPARAQLDLAIGWRSDSGPFLSPGGGLHARVPLTLEVGDRLALDLLTAALMPLDDGVRLELRVTGSAQLGPLGVAVAGLGIAVTLLVDPDRPPFDTEVVGRPPTGIGLHLDAGAVRGGGFIEHDPVTGRYSGAASLVVGDLGLQAFGILDTRLPDGDGGWSLLLFVQGSFPAIPLGFGFTLHAVGGIVGINRTVDTDALLAAARAGTVRQLIAPDNPVRDAPGLVEDASTLFPVARGQHLVGPTVRLGWGTPTLVTLDLALAVNLPSPLRLVVLGTLRAVLPHEDLAIVRLNVDVAGVLDLGASTMAMDGAIYDSHIQLIPLSGGFALRSAWGRTRTLAFSVGGLHPRFAPPPGFPALDRLSTDLSRGSFSLRLEGYVAITSNSLQLGAAADLRFSAAGFTVRGGLSFDALLTLDPFTLDVAIDAHVGLYRGGSRVFGVSLAGRLRGPNRWTITGKASIKVLFLTISVHVEVSFGDRRDVALGTVDAWRVLADELGAPHNWAADGGGGGVLLDARLERLPPDAIPAVAQKRLPLRHELEHLAGRRIHGATRFEVVGARVNGVAWDLGPASHEDFAPGDFRVLSDSDRLTAPGFEPLPAGQVLHPAGGPEIGPQVVADVSRETIVLDAPDEQPRRPRPVGWAAASHGRHRVRRRAAPKPRIGVRPEAWLAVDDDTAAAAGPAGSFVAAHAAAGAHATVMLREEHA